MTATLDRGDQDRNWQRRGAIWRWSGKQTSVLLCIQNDGGDSLDVGVAGCDFFVIIFVTHFSAILELQEYLVGCVCIAFVFCGN
jgi:hypothetical protein